MKDDYCSCCCNHSEWLTSKYVWIIIVTNVPAVLTFIITVHHHQLYYLLSWWLLNVNTWRNKQCWSGSHICKHFPDLPVNIVGQNSWCAWWKSLCSLTASCVLYKCGRLDMLGHSVLEYCHCHWTRLLIKLSSEQLEVIVPLLQDWILKSLCVYYVIPDILLWNNGRQQQHLIVVVTLRDWLYLSRYRYSLVNVTLHQVTLQGWMPHLCSWNLSVYMNTYGYRLHFCSWSHTVHGHILFG